MRRRVRKWYYTSQTSWLARPRLRWLSRVVKAVGLTCGDFGSHDAVQEAVQPQVAPPFLTVMA